MTTRPLTSDLTVEAYRHFSPYVQRCLAECGVRESDVPDLCHEVFLIVHAKSDAIDGIVHFDLWVREICRRVAAGYRRRSAHRREVLSSEPPLDSATYVIDPAETLGQDERVRAALAALDEESRELLALHDVGEMPLAELARLTLHDRKTVRKRLQLARRRLAWQLREVEQHPSASFGHDSHVRSARPGSPAGGFEVLEVTPEVLIGVVGNVVVTIWLTVPSEDPFDRLLRLGPELVERGGGAFGYLAIVESTGCPSAPARRKIVECLDAFGGYIIQYAAVLLGAGSWIVQPIMTGLTVLARPRFPMRFFKALEPAASWLADGCALGSDGPLPARELEACVKKLRALAGSSPLTA